MVDFLFLIDVVVVVVVVVVVIGVLVLVLFGFIFWKKIKIWVCCILELEKFEGDVLELKNIIV